jgi:hypothetical protein
MPGALQGVYILPGCYHVRAVKTPLLALRASGKIGKLPTSLERQRRVLDDPSLALLAGGPKE